MKVWTCTGFQGHWPVPTAAQLLNEELIKRGLPGDVTEGQMRRLATSKPDVLVLSEGVY